MARWLCGRCTRESPATSHRRGCAKENEDAGGLPQYEEVLGHGKALETQNFINSHSRFVIHDVFVSLDKLSRPPIGWKKR